MDRPDDDALGPLYTAFQAQQPGPWARPAPTLTGDALRTLAVRATQPDMPVEARECATAVLCWYLPDPAITAHLQGLLNDLAPAVRVCAATGLGPDEPAAEATLAQWLTIEDLGARPDHEDKCAAREVLQGRMEPLFWVGAPGAFATWEQVGYRFEVHDSIWEDIVELIIVGMACVHFSPELVAFLGCSGWDSRKENLGVAIGGHRDERSFQFLLEAYAAQEDGNNDDEYTRYGLLKGLVCRGDARALPFLRTELDRQHALEGTLFDSLDLIVALEDCITALAELERNPRPPTVRRPRARRAEHWALQFRMPCAGPPPPEPPWTTPATGPAPRTTSLSGWVWQAPEVDAEDAPDGWAQVPVVATLNGYRLRWAGLDEDDACLEQLAYCTEEDTEMNWMERTPQRPFFIAGAVSPVWTAWLLEEVHRRLSYQMHRSEAERWLAWMVFELAVTHGVLAERYPGA